MRRKLIVAIVAVALIAAACSDSDDSASDTEAADTAPVTTQTAAPEDDTGPPTGPAEMTLEAQDSDGATVTVASATLPAAGYIVIHQDDGGSPGAVIGHSDLLPAGVNTAIVVTLDSPLAESATVFPMVHIDADEDGIYEFNPPDETVDIPATFADGSVAVAPLEVTVAGGDAAGAAEVMVASSDFGDVLTDGDGNTLYVFLVDTQGEQSSCTGDCAETWPPLVDDIAVGSGVDADLLGTSERDDGSAQVTYNGWPLYYFAGDAAPGDTNGQGVGDVWYVVSPAGEAIQ